MNNQIVGLILFFVSIVVAVAACWPKKKSEVSREPLEVADLKLDGQGADLEQ